MAHKLNQELMQEAMHRRFNIRNISVIAHVDHGKSTLTDALVSRAGLIPENQSGQKRFTDHLEEEIRRGITIKSTAVTMFFEMNDERILKNVNQKDGNGFLVNLIDSPGHVDFSSEVTAALRVSDGALVVVDVVSGCCNQTETVLRQALSERIKPVLVINKLDRAILEQRLEPEKLYQRLRQIIDQVNYLIGVYSVTDDGIEYEENEGDKDDSVERKKVAKEEFKCSVLDPTKGNVAFAAGRDGWAFTIPQMADLYSKKRQQPLSSLIEKFWGENFYNSTSKKWQKSDKRDREDDKIERGFNQFVLDPIYKALDLCMEEKEDEVEKMADKLDIGFKLKSEEKGVLGGKDLMKKFMKKWLPAADALLELIVSHLPSPVEAQRYRVVTLYEGPQDDQAAIGIRECDPNGPLMVYISKMVPEPNDKNKFFAFGRIFSGSAEPGMKVRILMPEYKMEATSSDAGLAMKSLTR